MTLKIKFRPAKKAGDTGKLIYIVTHCGRRRQIATDYRLYPNEWDEKTQSIRPLPNDDRASVRQTIARNLQADRLRLNRMIRAREDQNRHFTVAEIVAELLGRGSGCSFFSFMQSVIERLRVLNKNGSADNYRYALNSFAKFRNHQDLCLEEMTSDLMEEYEAWLLKRGLSLNSVSVYMRNLHAAYARAVENGLCADLKPFRKVYTGSEQTTKRAVSFDLIKQIKELDLSHHPQLETARDIFMFQFYAMGISFMDASRLTPHNIVCHTIVYYRTKTAKKIIVPITPKLQHLIDKYRSDRRGYLLPILNQEIADDRRTCKHALRRVNNALKKIGEMVRAKEPLTSYVSRHSWASIARDRGVPIHLISQALGHHDIKTTEIYLSTLTTEKLRRANQVIFKGL